MLLASEEETVYVCLGVRLSWENGTYIAANRSPRGTGKQPYSVSVCQCCPEPASDADMWYTELSLAERGVEYRYLIVQQLRTGEDAGLRVTRRETFIQPRRLSVSRCSSPTDGELCLRRQADSLTLCHANLTQMSVWALLF